MSESLGSLLEARGLDPEPLVMRGWGASDRLGADTLAIPYFDNGVRVGTKYRTLGEVKRFAQDKGSAQILWNVDCLRDPTLATEPLILTEGEMDAAAALQAGYSRVVSVPGGAPATITGDGADRKYRFLDDAKALLDGVREIVLAVDGDGPGANLQHDLALRLGRARCKWVAYPKGCKDLGDALRLFGIRGVQETIRRAQWMPVPGIYRMSEVPPADDAPALDCGMEGLGAHYRLRLGDFSVVTGIPGMGKTTVINEIACRMAFGHGWNVVSASFEQRTKPDHQRFLRSFHARKAQNTMAPDEIERADAWVERHFTFLLPDDETDATLEWVLDSCAAAVRRNGANLVVVDPWNEMDHDRPPEMSLTEYTGFAIKSFKRFAKRHRVHLIVAAHPAKMQRGKDGKYPVPSLYDISDCYSEDTEVLTKRGWLRHRQIVAGDEVMAFDPANGHVAWAVPSRIVRHAYDGEMLRFKGYGFDMLVSPNHRMVVKPKWENPNETPTGRGRPEKWGKGKWSFALAADIPTGGHFAIPKGGWPLAGDDPETVVVDGRQFPAESFCELVGWWVAEGSWASSGASLCQSVGPRVAGIDRLIADCGLTPTRRVAADKRGFKDMTTWYFGARKDPEFVRWLRSKGGRDSATRCIPYPIFSMSPRLKLAFLRGYLDGDGHRPNERKGFSATTTSGRLYDDLMRLAVELGIPVCGHERAVASANHAQSFQINFGRPERAEVTLRASRHRTSESYRGDIWCLTVPSGAYVTRRNGAVVVCGNSAHWANKPDIGIVVHRESLEPGGKSTIRVVKSRYHDVIGRPGEITGVFDSATSRYKIDRDDGGMFDDR